MAILEKIFGTYSQRELKSIETSVRAIMDLEEKYTMMTDQELQAQTDRLKERLGAGESMDQILPDAFAVCREAGSRVLGMKHFQVQVIGGIVLHRGEIAEMQTGEGKTLMATLPVYLNALTGKGVHVVTVNDYLARRDSEWMGKLYRFLGLTVGLVYHGMEPEERKKAYAADITYGTNNEFGFDYLRDNMAKSKDMVVQRGHYFAIVDEVDSILIDEARTPLIISGAGEEASDLYKRVDEFAKTLKKSTVVELDEKLSQEEQIDGDYVVDEKHKSVTLSESGIHKAEAYFDVENIADLENVTLLHHIEQAIRAHGIMHRDVDYVVRDNQVVIVDEYTGRLMFGRRFNNGLHQAIEAKEGVIVAGENKTLATITFQNYFLMYEKLSGMTGTAATEEEEFREIYGLEIVCVPTNKPKARVDMPDLIYKSIKAKYAAVVRQVMECYEQKRPVLVGTTSIEKSELIAGMLKKEGVPCTVLNAKNHDQEAEIVAQAGRLQAVTIATNMAGRGTDILLGGNADYMAKRRLKEEGVPPELIAQADGKIDSDDPAVVDVRSRYNELRTYFRIDVEKEAQQVRQLGGLFIIGTERHESRRVDNQLRGRAGRQGDPGNSRFFLSVEDDLLRIFGGERMQRAMESAGLEDDQPIENKILTGSLENAQKRLEAQHFSMRKNVMKYDSVMNKQREIIYEQRRRVMNGEDIHYSILEMLETSIRRNVDSFLAGDEPQFWDLDALNKHYAGWLCNQDEFVAAQEQGREIKKEDVCGLLCERGRNVLRFKEEKYGVDNVRALERQCLLHSVDTKWMEHIDNMEWLKNGIGLRGYAQKDPVVEYTIEGFNMFDGMIAEIQDNTIRSMMLAQFQRPVVNIKMSVIRM